MEEFNTKLCVDCDLAPVTFHSIVFGSLACGHVSMGLWAIAAGMSSDAPLLSEVGRLSTDKISKRDAIREGLCWHIASHAVRKRFPGAFFYCRWQAGANRQIMCRSGARFCALARLSGTGLTNWLRSSPAKMVELLAYIASCQRLFADAAHHGVWVSSRNVGSP